MDNTSGPKKVKSPKLAVVGGSDIDTHTVKVTFFPDEFAKRMKVKELTLPQMEELFRTTTAISKKDLPYIKMAVFNGKKSQKNCYRKNEFVTEITGVEAEHDTGDMPFEEALTILRKVKLRCILYTSPSFVPVTKEKWRVVLPTSNGCPPDMRYQLVARVNGLLNGKIESESFTLSQGFHYGHVNNPHHRVEVLDGDFIDLRPDLDAGAIGRDKRKNNFIVAKPLDPLTEEEMRAAVAAIPNTVEFARDALRGFDPHKPLPKSTWEFWRNVSMAICNGDNGDLGKELFFEFSKRHEHYDEAKTEQRWEEVTGSPPDEITVRTLIWYADHGDPQWRKPKSIGSVLVRASDIKMKPKEWLWPGHLLRGALELLTGIPGLGKSQVQIHYIACVTTGKAWPDGAAGGKLASVIMLTAEDALDIEVVPRLTAAGADLTRVHILKKIKTDKKTNRQFLLGEDLDELKRRIIEIGDVALVTIDPITAYMGGIDSHKTTEVRGQLGPLKDLAEETNIAFSAITHPPKSTSQKAIDHFIGSQAFIAAGRIGHLCIPEFEEEEKSGVMAPTGRMLFAHAKHNSSVKMPTLAFKISETVIQQDLTGTITAPHVVWEEGPVEITADEAVVSAAKGGRTDPKKKIDAFLEEMIKDGPVPKKKVEDEAKARGITPKQLRMGIERLGLVVKQEGKSLWNLRPPIIGE